MEGSQGQKDKRRKKDAEEGKVKEEKNVGGKLGKTLEGEKEEGLR